MTNSRDEIDLLLVPIMEVGDRKLHRYDRQNLVVLKE